MIESPLVIFFFNRPDSLRRLVNRLAMVKPKMLYLVCDGARINRPDEKKLVDESRSIFENLTWCCNIQKNYSDTNLGCRQRIISGLDWVFKREEMAIILEDDCIPIADFFPFCEEMLERYKNDVHILSVGGTNFRPQLSLANYDITFSKYAMIWGWATWRRAWQLLDRDLQLMSKAKESHHLKKWLGSWRAEWYWLYILKKVPSSWGYRWAFTGFMNQGIHLLPAKCLVENIGFTKDQATHTSTNIYDLPACADEFLSPYRCPISPETNQVLDKWIEDHVFSRSLIERLKWVLKKIIRR
jgi:hypothetical protein